MQVYINDMLVKTKEEEELLSNLETMFGCLRKPKMRLNLKKCVFVVEAGKFLGFMLYIGELKKISISVKQYWR